jgi:sortase A
MRSRRLLIGTGVALVVAAVSVLVYLGAAEHRSGTAAPPTASTPAPGPTAPAVEVDDPRMEAAPDSASPPPGPIPAAPAGPTVPGLVAESPPPAGGALGRIVIPTAGVDAVIVAGIGPEHLAAGPGHMPGTAVPGQPGNSVVSGHRTTHGAPFFGLDRLLPGDPIEVETSIGTHLYRVVEVLVVRPDDVWVTGDAPGGWLTLTTCHPLFQATERLVVFARLDSGPNAAAITAAAGDYRTPPRPPGG